MIEFSPNPVVLASSLLVWLICLLVLEIIRRQSPHPIDGLRQWMAAIGFAAMGSITLVVHNKYPGSPHYGLAGFFMIGISVALYSSLRAFTQRPLKNLTLGIAMLCSFVGICYFTYLYPNPQLRLAFSSSICAGIYVCCYREIRKIKLWGGPEQFTAGMFIILLVVNLLRLATLLLGVIDPAGIFGGPEPQRFYLIATSMIVLTLTIGFTLMVDRKQQALLMYRVSRDGQTGAYMRNAFFEILARELNRTQRSGSPLTLMMIDIDKFKHINDTWGHQTGDLVIADFVAIAQASLRDYDALGRYGGDEFMILLPDTRQEEARVVAERIRSQCASSSKAGIPPFSISIGLYCTAVGNESLEAVMAAADKALYRAKQSGRNRIEVDSNLGSQRIIQAPMLAKTEADNNKHGSVPFPCD